jgi:hypothetical protein
VDQDLWIEIIIQLCRIQVQREREKLRMTPKMRGALESLRKLQHHADVQAEKLTDRIETEAMPRLNEGFKRAHARVDELGGIVDGIENFVEELGNGGPLGGSDEQSTRLPPRSSEVSRR